MKGEITRHPPTHNCFVFTNESRGLLFSQHYHNSQLLKNLPFKILFRCLQEWTSAHTARLSFISCKPHPLYKTKNKKRHWQYLQLSKTKLLILKQLKPYLSIYIYRHRSPLYVLSPSIHCDLVFPIYFNMELQYHM